MKRTISTAQAPAAVGPYAQAVWAGDFLFMSGQIPIHPQTGLLSGDDIQSQTRQVLHNVQAVLASQSLTAQDVVKTTVFLTDLAHFNDVNALYADFFTGEPPARSCVQVAALPKGALVEMECIAYRPAQS